MAAARLSCLDPICALLVKRTSGDMIISGRVYVLGNDLLDEDLRVLPLAPTTPALTVGNPVRWYFVVANRHPKPKEAAPIPALTSTSTADDRISSSPTQSRFTLVSAALARHHALLQCMQPRSLESAPTSQSILSRRSSPRAARPYDCRAIPMRFPTMHTVFEEVHPPRAAARRTWPRRFGPPETTHGRVPGTVDALAFWRVSGRGTGMHRCPSRAILHHPSSRSCCLPTSRALRASVFSCCSVHRRSSRGALPTLSCCREDLAGRGSAIESMAAGHRAHLHPVLPAGLFAPHLISSRRALQHLDYATMRFRGDAGSGRCACAAAGPAGSGSFWGHYRLISPRTACSPVCQIRPSRISTARRGVRGGVFALQLGDVDTAAWVFGTPQAVYRAYGIHFTPLHAR
ncbi:hypothetical protein B0H14DRAFT_3674735 [Mycena olivaceomarginata]|nr:hypothetical protein B0H14DRAFT_3674735 [Mycena olivaceomarginata]